MTYEEHLKLIEQRAPRVFRPIQEKSARELAALDTFHAGFSGTICAVKILRSGQSGPYKDSITEAIIFCYQPNCYTTGGPSARIITKDQARELARVFVGSWETDFTLGEKRKFLETALEVLEPTEVPGAIGEDIPRSEFGKDMYSCWRVVLRSPYTD